MTQLSYSSFSQWYNEGPLSTFVRARKSAGGIINLIEAAQPAGDMSDPAVPDLVLYQDLIGGTRVSGDLGGGRFDVVSEKGGFFLAAPNFTNTVIVDCSHQLRSLAFPMVRWQSILDEATNGKFSFDWSEVSRSTFASPNIRSAVRKLWVLAEEEGTPSRLLAQSAGCNVLAELLHLVGAPVEPIKSGLAPWVKKRCLELMHARLSEDISLEELAAEAGLSQYHFARMFKHSIGAPPRAYLTRLRMQKACDLLERTDLSIMDIAFEVGYSSSQVLARVFIKHQHMSPSDYRRAFRS